MSKRSDHNTERQLQSIKGIFEDQNALSFNVFQHMPIGICVTDSNGIFTDVNATYCDIYGYTKDELIGNSFTYVVPEEYQEKLVSYHDEFMKKQYELQGRWTVKNKNDEKFDIIANAAFLKTADDDKRKMTLVVKAEELEDTVKRLETTIAILERKLETQDIANRLAEHDLRNRLSSIVSVADILSKSKVDEKQRKWIDTIKRIGKDTLLLLSSARDFARMERGEFEPTITEFDLVTSLANVTKDYMETIEQKELEIYMLQDGRELEPSTDEILVKGDEFYLEHMFQNLLGNAIDASPKREKITIDIKCDDELKISFSNMGMIPEEIQPTFFEKYTTSGKDRGTGLGTYIARMIAGFHGGNISFISSKEHGTTLFVVLPIECIV
ncbi:histidine kinase [Nonlabens sp. YIK11]|uniref:PAS domain-containing sensor histidine kinase n=1 Tax=Nonlabens sp. YIK11 TaxID=1453349 RepID=UPI0006DC9A1C|nr:PAS domain-containing sensor histidine kinase [Nonlabens sp. YIK11]KQC33566.1 histidine kinase [Nonlabens sp. YIK11]